MSLSSLSTSPSFSSILSLNASVLRFIALDPTLVVASWLKRLGPFSRTVSISTTPFGNIVVSPNILTLGIDLYIMRCLGILGMRMYTRSDSMGEIIECEIAKLHPSSVLPCRWHDGQIADSVKACGVQQPLIVRPMANKPGEYEIIDGLGRYESLDGKGTVSIDVRQNSTDADVFRISEATSKRTQRSTYENAFFYARYLEAVKGETGEEGALARMAAETQISESELSQYLKINKLFMELDAQDEDASFRRLKEMGINKLYKLTELLGKPGLVEAAHEIEADADNLTLEGISAIVNARQPVSLLEMEMMSNGISEPAQGTVAASGGFVDRSSINRFNELSEKVSTRIKELSVRLQETQIETLLAETGSPKTMNVLEKMLTTIRRLNYYIGMLKGAQKKECPETA